MALDRKRLAHIMASHNGDKIDHVRERRLSPGTLGFSLSDRACGRMVINSHSLILVTKYITEELRVIECAR